MVAQKWHILPFWQQNWFKNGHIFPILNQNHLETAQPINIS